MDFIDLKTQQNRIREGLKVRFDRILEHGAYIMGPEVTELEEKLAGYCGVKHAISCSSGTDALLIPLMAWNIGPGDAVFTTPFTYVATAEVISLLGATPVFVDVYESTFNIDCEKLELAIQNTISEGKLTPKAIIPVDLFGVPARYRLIEEIAKKYDLKVIEDAAQSFGGAIRDKKVGTFGDVAATSFYPAKPLGCYGDGGAIFTNDDNLASKCKAIRIHGTTTDKYNSKLIGLNGRLDSLQATVLLEKLTIFDEELDFAIRTPLSSIIGLSELIIEDTYEKLLIFEDRLKKVFSKYINNFKKRPHASYTQEWMSGITFEDAKKMILEEYENFSSSSKS